MFSTLLPQVGTPCNGSTPLSLRAVTIWLFDLLLLFWVHMVKKQLEIQFFFLLCEAQHVWHHQTRHTELSLSQILIYVTYKARATEGSDCCHFIQRCPALLSSTLPPPPISQQELKSALKWLLILLPLFLVLCNPAAASANEQLHESGKGRPRSKSSSRLESHTVCVGVLKV